MLVFCSVRPDEVLISRPEVYNLLEGQRVDMLIGVVIILNSASIGGQISAELEGNADLIRFFQDLEYFYVTVYTAELGLRFFAMGLACLRSIWVRFDAFLVAISYFALVVEPMLRGDTNLPLGALNILKMFRFMRLQGCCNGL